MKVYLFLLFFVGIAWAAPHLKLTVEEFRALNIALNGRKPLFLQSALPLWAIKNAESDNKYVYYNIGGKDPLHARLEYTGPTRNIHKTNEISQLKEESRNPLQMARMRSKSPEDLLLPIYRGELANIKPISKRRSFTTRDESARRRSRRDTYDNKEEEEEEQVVYAEELSFGLSTGGGVLGGAVGGYLDTTGVATLKLIRTLENLGGVALGQFDDFLDSLAKEKSSSNSYGAPPTSYSL